MKNKWVKNLIFSLTLLVCTMPTVNATTIIETTGEDSYATIETNSIIVGVTKFEADEIVTVGKVAEATYNYMKLNGDNPDVEVPSIFYYLEDAWYEIDKENNTEIIEDLEKLEIYFVNNEEKMLEITVECEVEEGYELVFESNNSEKDSKIKYEDGILYVPATVSEVTVFLKEIDSDEKEEIETWSKENPSDSEFVSSINGENTVLEGDGQTFHRFAPSTLTFRSAAPLSEFQEVKVNGVTVDPSNYTLTEGSTIVTLSIDYLKTLDVAAHEITVVSDSGSPSAGFEVIAPDLNEYGFYYNQPYTAYVDMFSSYMMFFIRKDGTLDVVGTETCTYSANEKNITVNSSMGTINGTVSADGMEIYFAELATTFKLGDESIVADEDYIYIYDDSLCGYEVYTIDKTQASYGAIKANINGIPLKRISNYMFADNPNLTTLPEFPTDWMILNNTGYVWGEGLFEGCTSLTTAVIPNCFGGLPFRCFANCTSLSSVSIPTSITDTGNEVFENCTSLTTITFEGTIAQWNAIGTLSNPDDYYIFDNVPATQVICLDGVVEL